MPLYISSTIRHPYVVQFASRMFLHDYAQNYFSQPWSKLLAPVPNAKLLLLLGDIGFRQARHTHDFIQYCSKNWEKIIWIEGRKETERNIDGSIPCSIPANVIYVNKPTILSLETKFIPDFPIHSTKSLLLYATPAIKPLYTYAELKYLQDEAKKEFYNNYLIVATYNNYSYSSEFYPANCIAWFQGSSYNNSLPTVNMYKHTDGRIMINYSPIKQLCI